MKVLIALVVVLLITNVWVYLQARSHSSLDHTHAETALDDLVRKAVTEQLKLERARIEQTLKNKSKIESRIQLSGAGPLPSVAPRLTDEVETTIEDPEQPPAAKKLPADTVQGFAHAADQYKAKMNAQKVSSE